MALEMKYFVLKPRSQTPSDPYAAASRLAIWVYAQSIELVNPQLAIDLKDWCNQESDAAARLSVESVEPEPNQIGDSK